jgi:hypothetical protein
MGEKSGWPCWEIMNCDESEKCPAKTHPEIPCWEIAREMDDYRHVLQICTDCIVHVLFGSVPCSTEKRITVRQAPQDKLYPGKCSVELGVTMQDGGEPVDAAKKEKKKKEEKEA